MKSKKGFTLIELIVVLAILAIVAAIAVPTAFGSIQKAQIAADKASIDSINSAIRTQAALIKLDAGTNMTVQKALEGSGINLDAKAAYSGTGVTFNKASAEKPASYTYSSDDKTGSGGTWRTILATENGLTSNINSNS